MIVRWFSWWKVTSAVDRRWNRIKTLDKCSSCCRTNHSKTATENNDSVYFAHRFAGGVGGDILSLLYLASGGVTGGRKVESSEGHSLTCLVVDADCWPGPTWGRGWNTYLWPFIRPLIFPTVWWLGSRGECPKREPGGSCISFYDLTLKVTQHHFLHILLVEAVRKSISFK